MLQSSIAWLDHDPEAHERMQRILRLFDERDTRDELGLGAIRDSFSDRLFPGTSTIQTRLRYFFFIPWIYRRIEEDRVPPREARAVAREWELDLSEALTESGETDGVFGQQAGRRLKTLPSAIYWAGLAIWGIRRFDGTRNAYLSAARDIALRRDRLAQEDAWEENPGMTTWDPNLPPRPDDFPKGATLTLIRAEAEHLRDRVAQSCPGSLLSHLFLEASEPDGDFPWEHPNAAGFAERHRTTLHHARLFSHLSHGAALLYNLLLSEAALGRDDREKLIEGYREELQEWKASLPLPDIETWDLNDLWPLVFDQGHRISGRARGFVQDWKDRVTATGGEIADDSGARAIIRKRESWTKGPRARLSNEHLLKQWGGRSAADPFIYRWSDVKTFITDLRRGLEHA